MGNDVKGVLGFTLIELLVTVVILSTGIVLILQAFQTSMVALAESRDSMRSAALSHALVVQGELDVRSGGSIGVDDSALETLYPDYRWRVDTRANSDLVCTNSSTIQHEVVVMVQHEVTGREAEVASWVQVKSQEDPGVGP
ncbi:MAG: type II secretion system protein [Kiritimatiellia bacterium]|jgi:prepilin-type N-terminal cleavage/methylation domain-containing protein|nr:type II secretion system protein [Kiritimatiellia bacterium]MDP6809143.1 type II secretion system protein [Kiritimatiellia bacterium]MDP7023164.1 type II secretion system protein [Kiritimatiellia bacterium]